MAPPFSCFYNPYLNRSRRALHRHGHRIQHCLAAICTFTRVSLNRHAYHHILRTLLFVPSSLCRLYCARASSSKHLQYRKRPSIVLQETTSRFSDENQKDCGSIACPSSPIDISYPLKYHKAGLESKVSLLEHG